MPEQTMRPRINIETRGTETVEKANRLVEQFEKSLRKVAEAGAALYVVKQGFDAVVNSVTSATKAVIQHIGSVDAAVTSYRTLRFAMSPTAFTAGAIALGAAAEAAIRLANARAKLIEQNALLAAQSGRRFSTVESFGLAGRIQGNAGLGTLLTGGGFSPDQIVKTIQQLKELEDPIDRADLAVKRFGDDAAKILPLLNDRLASNIDAAQALARTLDDSTRASIQRLRDDLSLAGQIFSGVTDNLRALREEARLGITVRVAAVFDVGRGVLQAAGKGPGAFGFPAGSFPSNPSDEEFRRGGAAAATAALERSRAGGLGGIQDVRGFVQGTPELRARARGILGANTLENAQMELAAARASRQSLGEAFLGAEGDKGIAGEVVAADRRLRLAEAVVTSLQIRAAEVSAAVAKVISRLEGETLVSPSGEVFLSPREFQAAFEKRARGALQLQVGGAGDAEAQLLADRQLGRGVFRDRGPQLTQLGLRSAAVESEGERDQLEAFDRSLVESERTRANLRRESLLRELDATARIVELRAGPGGELGAALKVRDLRLSIAQTETEAQKARLDFELRIAEIQKQQRQELRSGAGSVFDALIAGGAGIRRFTAGLALTVGRSVFQNIAEIGLGGATGKLSLPGTGTAAKPSLLGRILSGTPFGPKNPLDASAVALTGSAIALTQAASVLAASGGGRIAAGFGDFAGAVPGFGGFGGGAGGGSTTTLSGIGGTGIGTFTPARGASFSTAQKTVGALGIGAGTFFGVKAGVNQGGVQGGLVAGSAVAGGVASAIALGLLGSSAATGPLAPIVAGIGLALGATAAFLGNPKERGSRQLDTLIENSRFTDAASIDRQYDLYGNEVDTDRRGNIRSHITINVNAVDAKSILDRSDDIGYAVYKAIQDRHPMVYEMGAALNPA
jgi:hypothetical protein